MLRLVSSVTTFLLAVAQGSAALSYGKVYWSDSEARRIQRANLNGTRIETVVPDAGSPWGLAADAWNARLYWAEDDPFTLPAIRGSNLDGSDQQVLVSEPWDPGIQFPQFIALDVEGGKMYYTSGNTRSIERASLDGTSRETILHAELNGPVGIALDLKNQYIYWTHIMSTHSRICRSSLDGSWTVQLLYQQGFFYDIELDPEGGYMYWADQHPNYRAIRRANLDGTDPVSIVSGIEPSGIALDLKDGKVYWSTRGTPSIQRANLDGTKVETLVSGANVPGLKYTMDVAVVYVPCDIASSAGEDCNQNGIRDECDIASGTSRDQNEDGMPDECEVPPPVLYVDAKAAGQRTGASWQDAYTELEEALARAAAFPGAVAEIWVAEGTYRPRARTVPEDPRSATFRLLAGVGVYGGFGGWELALDQRDWRRRPTVLSGDHTCYHIITSRGTDRSAILDGFSITAGAAMDEPHWPGPSNSGAGMHLSGGASPTIRNCVFRDNSAFYGGGGISCTGGSSPELFNCAFIANQGHSGGAIHLDPGTYGRLTNCSFFGNENSAIEGYGSTVTLVNCLFAGNGAGEYQYALFFDYSGATLVNCTLAGSGAAIGIDGGADVRLRNCILWGNASLTCDGCDSGIEATYSCIQTAGGPFPGAGNTDENPRLVDPDGADNVIGTEDDDLRPGPDSPCIDAADNTAVPDWALTDLAGNPRRLDDPFTADSGIGPAPVVDMGGYEYVSDCNGNGVPDDQEVASGKSEDRNGNGIPDECEEPSSRRAVRSFAGGCVSRRDLTVIIDVWLDASAGTYALEEMPPPGWNVLGISHDGAFDPLTGKVKWGPFFDGEEMHERFWYSVHLALSHVEPDAEFCFGPGTLSVNGQGLAIEGAVCAAPCRQHPADGDGDWRIVIDEVTSYGHCWQRGCEWASPPVPIPISYVTRVGYLWRNGESYCRHPDIEPPLGWVPCFGEDWVPRAAAAAGSAAAPARAERAIALSGQPEGLGVNVALTVVPAAGSAAYAIEEAPPAGWAVTAIDGTGSIDPTTGKLKWGPFLDSKSRTFIYCADPWTPRRGPQVFAGTVSADGIDQPVEGVSTPPAPWGASDGDGDQIPDGWEILRGLATGVKNEGDSDGDSALDLEEYGAGTDPFDAADVFTIQSVRIVPGAVLVGISGRAGRRYRLLAGASAANPLAEWQPLPAQGQATVDGEPVVLAVPLGDLPPGGHCLRATVEPVD